MFGQPKKSRCASNYSRLTLAGWLAASFLAFYAHSASADIILANSVADWQAAINDGIGVGGSSVLAGSAEDAAQQGHADTEGNGIWNYKAVDNPAGGTFGTSPGFFSVWNQGGWGHSNDNIRMRSTTMTPNGTFFNGTLATREWIGDGLAGETLRVFGEFSTEHNTAAHSNLNNGVQLLVLIDHFVLLDQQMAPGGTVSFDFNLVTVQNAPRLRFLVGPAGPVVGVHGAQDFFNDSTQFNAQIHLVGVPEPWVASLFLIGLAGVYGCRRNTQTHQ